MFADPVILTAGNLQRLRGHHLRITGQDAGEAQQVVHPPFRQRHGLRRGSAAAAQFRADKHLTASLHHAVVEHVAFQLGHEQRVGRTKGGGGGQTTGFEFPVGHAVGGGKGQQIQGAAAGVNIQCQIT